MKTDKIVKGKRKMVPDGEPIQNYYPKIIDEKIFYKTQEQLDLRKRAFGKIGARNNLFSGLVKCGHCGATMQYGTRGQKRYQYLNCRESVKGNCDFLSIRYKDVEDAFLLHCYQLKLPDIIKDDMSEHEKQIAEFKKELLVFKNKIKQSQQKVENYSEAIGTDMGGSRETVKHFINLIDQEKSKEKNYSASKQRIKRKISHLDKIYQKTENSLKTLKAAIKQISNSKDEERENIRRKLQMVIRNLVEKIEIYPRGPSYLLFKKRLKRKDQGQGQELQLKLKKLDKLLINNRRCKVFFRSGGALSFVHDGKTGGLRFSQETDQDGLFTKKTYDTIVENIGKKDFDETFGVLLPDEMQRLNI